MRSPGAIRTAALLACGCFLSACASGPTVAQPHASTATAASPATPPAVLDFASLVASRRAWVVDISTLRVGLEITGQDGFALADHSDMAQISRQPADLAGQLLNPNHQYPDGAMLYLGTMFAPTKDRDGKGLGFTHKSGDVVAVSSPQLGRLVNEVQPCHAVEPWSFGTRALMENLAARGVLA